MADKNIDPCYRLSARYRCANNSGTESRKLAFPPCGHEISMVGLNCFSPIPPKRPMTARFVGGITVKADAVPLPKLSPRRDGFLSGSDQEIEDLFVKMNSIGTPRAPHPNRKVGKLPPIRTTDGQKSPRTLQTMEMGIRGTSTERIVCWDSERVSKSSRKTYLPKLEPNSNLSGGQKSISSNAEARAKIRESHEKVKHKGERKTRDPCRAKTSDSKGLSSFESSDSETERLSGPLVGRACLRFKKGKQDQTPFLKERLRSG